MIFVNERGSGRATLGTGTCLFVNYKNGIGLFGTGIYELKSKLG